MEEDNKDKNNRRKIINFILIIVIIIIILLLSSCFNFGTINNYVPTGNIDIFDITIDKSCCKELEDCKCTCSDNKDDNNKEPIVYNDSNYKPSIEAEKKEAKIFDNKLKKYNNSTKLNIFSNPAYEFKSIIAPLSSNVYQFVVRNSNDFPIQYELIVEEENEYNINMKYKLKKDGYYIIGDSDNWVTYEELKLYNNELMENSKNVYQLEWKWFESSNDTYIGEVGKDYKLKISFDGEQI